LLALKFVEEVILLYTPDPYGTSEPPSHEGNDTRSLTFTSCPGCSTRQKILICYCTSISMDSIWLCRVVTYFAGSSVEFNISWLRGGHPVLNVGDLSIEASRKLSLLLDQLRMPTVKSISNLMIIVLVNR